MKKYMENAKYWAENECFDIDTRKEVQKLIDSNNLKELEERFYTDLEFGTGGLRGIMGVGTNRMNRYVIRRATQGLANYIIKKGDEYIKKGVAIAHDPRNNSSFFALESACVLAANGIKAYLYTELHPTPLLSFATRYLNAAAGINVTASHNPKEYNGYKVYWEDGAQVVSPNDKNIINEVLAISDFSKIKYITENEAIKKELLIYIDENVDSAYFELVKSIQKRPEIAEKVKNFNIVYTPIHGAGNKPVIRALNLYGFKNIYVVNEQKLPDGNFSTVDSPNPENSSSFKIALNYAKKHNAKLILGTDPDSDRVGIAVLHKNEYKFLTGNQIGVLFAQYICETLVEKNIMPKNPIIIKSIVTTDLIKKIAENYNVDQIDVLTGFKYIGEKMLGFEKNKDKEFIFGCEESYGYLFGDFVRDKDAVIACAFAAEMTAYYNLKGKTLIDILYELFEKYGCHAEKVTSKVFKGKEGVEKMASIMENIRNNPLKEVCSIPVSYIKDYKKSISFPISDPTKTTKIDLPSSNVIALYLKDGSTIVIRPSGTEPKIKFYYGAVVNDKLSETELIEKANKKIEDFEKEMEKLTI